MSCRFNAAIAVVVTACVSAGSSSADDAVVATSIVAGRASAAGPPIEVAAAENEAGIVSTAMYRPEPRPASASSAFVSTQLKSVEPASSPAGGDGLGDGVGDGLGDGVGDGVDVVADGPAAATVDAPGGPAMSAAANCRPSGTVWSPTVTGSSSFTIAAVIR